MKKYKILIILQKIISWLENLFKKKEKPKKWIELRLSESLNWQLFCETTNIELPNKNIMYTFFGIQEKEIERKEIPQEVSKDTNNRMSVEELKKKCPGAFE